MAQASLLRSAKIRIPMSEDARVRDPGVVDRQIADMPQCGMSAPLANLPCYLRSRAGSLLPILQLGQ